MDEFFLFTSISILITYLSLLISNKYSLLIYNANEAHKEKFKNRINIVGGFIIFVSLSIFFFFNLLKINYVFYIYCLSIFIIGIRSDLIQFNPKIRLSIIYICTLLTLLVTKDYIYDYKITLLNNFFLNNYYIAIFFTSVCLATLINGVNFIDGLHGLVIMYNLLIIIFLNIFLKFIIGVNPEAINILNLMVPILVLLLYFNLKEKIFLGDSGSYLLGAIFGYSIIKISLEPGASYPYVYAAFLIYPSFEVLFSITRKLVNNKNPFSPDKKHIHHLIEKFVNIKFLLNKNKCKIISSIFINIYILIFFSISIFLYKYKWLLILNIFIFCLVYVLIYIKLKKSFL